MTAMSESRFLTCLGVIVAVFASSVLVVVLAYGRGDFDGGYELSAVFPTSAQGLFTDGATEVKLRGVPVGTVRGVELLDDAQVRVTMRMDAGVPVPVTTEARIEPLSVFGPKFVNLIPGSAEQQGPFLSSGDQIGRASTGTDLTDVLAGATVLFGAVDPADLVTVFDAVSTGVAGLGDTIGGGIDDGAALVDVAHRNRDRVGPFLSDTAVLATTIESRSERLLLRIDDYTAVADLVANRGDELARLLDGVAHIATTADVLVEDLAVDFDITVRSLAVVLAGIHDDRELIPAAFDTVGAFFDMLGAGMRLPGPDGKKLTALKGFVTADVCLVFGVCLLPDGGIQALGPGASVGSPPSAPATATSSSGDRVVDSTLPALAELLVGSPAAGGGR